MNTLIGPDLTQTVTVTQYQTEGRGFALGDRVLSSGAEWVYVLASNSITAYDAVRIEQGYVASQLTIDTGKDPAELGFAQFAFDDGEYGFVMVGGTPLIRLAADCDKNVALYATSTGGVLDDATTSVKIQGVICTTSVTGATTAATCISRFPTLDRADTKAGA